MRLITLIFIFVTLATNASVLDEIKSKRASVYDIGLLGLEMHFSEPINVGLNLYRKGIISGRDNAQYKSVVTIYYGPPSFEKDKIVIEVHPPFNVNSINQNKDISRNRAADLATAYFNSIRESLGIVIRDNGDMDDQSWLYIGKWFSPRGASVESRKRSAYIIGQEIILKTVVRDVRQVGFLTCETRGISGEVLCRAFGE